VTQIACVAKFMVTVTRLNGSELAINAELIESLEATPDTIITLTNGKKYIAHEPVDEVIRRVIDYRRRTLQNLIYYREEAKP
jgi:flagellar protein FlbD